MLKFAIFLTVILQSSALFAEYRVYQYYIKSKVENLNSPNAQVVTSTLNPESYKTYNGGRASIDVTLLRSWMCYGNTSYQDVCTISDGKELVGSTAEGLMK